MTDAELLAASADERARYAELLAAYRALAEILDVREPATLDLAAVAEREARAETAVAGLRALAAALAPHRLRPEAVPPGVQALWRESAALAAAALEANAALAARARAHRDGVRDRLDTVRAGRRGLAGYRPRATPARALTDQRA
jgi:hypothetical protein